MAWNNTDYDDLAGQDPYRHHAFEMHFGLTDSRGKAQAPAGRDGGVRRDAATRSTSPAASVRQSDAALVVPSYLDTVYPFTVEQDRTYLADMLRQAYVSARLADLPLALTRESDGIGHDARLYLVPSAKQLLSPTWHELEALAAGGATVYVSYSAGTDSVHAGPWYARLNEMFGVEHQLGYGAPARVEDEKVTLSSPRISGRSPAARSLPSVPPGTERAAAYLPVRPDGAEVVAVDGHDRPALPAAPHRRGLDDPVHLSDRAHGGRNSGGQPRGDQHALRRAGDPRGRGRPVTVDDPRVAADVLVHSDGSQFAWLVSHAAEPVTVKPQLASGAQLCTLDGTPASATLALAPFGVRVFRIHSGTEKHDQ